MTLLRKFGVLVGVLALVVALNLGTATWAIFVLHRESSTYLSDTSVVLGGLNRVKRELGEIAALVPHAAATPEESAAHADRFGHEFEALAGSARSTVASLNASGMLPARMGISTTLNLERRIESALESARQWHVSGDPEHAAAARVQFLGLHELIERNESKILGDTTQAVQHSADIRRSVLGVLAIALAIAIGVAVLGVALVRRWVLRPVTELRTAAGRFAAGDFTHRVPVRTSPAGEGRDELALLSAEINHMAGMIAAMQDEQIERERLAAIGEMVRRLAHNLRNPLAGIRSLAELTKADLPPADPAQENQDRIISTIDRFEGWLSALLSATTPLQLEYRQVAVPAWLATLAEPMRPLAASRGVEIVIDAERAPETAAFDPRHLEQALVGIINNAIQVSAPGDRITLAARGAGPGEWTLRVEDRGPGVPAELAERIFRPYFTTRRDGTGIGLAVARQVVEQHGGRIVVEAASGPAERPGAAFALTLPLTPRGGRATEMASIGHIGGSGGQDPDDRGRGEPAVLHPADAEARRA